MTTPAIPAALAITTTRKSISCFSSIPPPLGGVGGGVVDVGSGTKSLVIVK